jgi:hypothetical protein
MCDELTCERRESPSDKRPIVFYDVTTKPQSMGDDA